MVFLFYILVLKRKKMSNLFEIIHHHLIPYHLQIPFLFFQYFVIHFAFLFEDFLNNHIYHHNYYLIHYQIINKIYI